MRTMNGLLIEPKLQLAWLKRIGIGGFLFFLIKGLLWLMVPAMLAILGLG